MVPTGAGEARQPHSHGATRAIPTIRYLPDGKHLLAVGIEAGHGGRDSRSSMYGNGECQARYAGRHHRRSPLCSPDGRRQYPLVMDSEGKWGVWSLDSEYPAPDCQLGFGRSTTSPAGAPDGSSAVRALEPVQGSTPAKVYLVNVNDREDGLLEDVWRPHRLWSNHGRRFSTLLCRRPGLTYIYVQTTVRGVRGEGSEVTPLATTVDVRPVLVVGG